MSEKIFTIPINEAFDAHDGCPLCRLKADLEESTLSYVLGAAMMEPDVRIKMNGQGFCENHFSRLRQMKNKLALALILESHLAELENMHDIPFGGKKGMFSKSAPSDAGDRLAELSSSCFACRKIRHTQQRYYSNIAYLWDSDEKFREKLKSQPFICLTHSAGILSAGRRELKDDKYKSLYTALTELNKVHLGKLKSAITEFTVSFDHRNADTPLSDEARNSIENALEFLK